MRALAVLALCVAGAHADGHLCEATDGVFTLKVNFFAGPSGYYEVVGCDGTNPTLSMTRGVEYTFNQDDASNWFHPLGLAYYPDGAHGYGDYAEVPELEHPTPDDCDEAHFACNPGDGVNQAPLYGTGHGGETYDDWNNPDVTSAGLDFYEPLFQVPEDQWETQGPYTVKITIPTDSKTAEFYYFCHIHPGMSGIILVSDPDPAANEVLNVDLSDGYYTVNSGFDEECGTTGVNAYEDTSTFCPGNTFLCEETDTTFNKCMAAIDCKMSYEMRAEASTNPLEVFMHQMIPHHENAVNMAKIAMKHAATATGYDDEDTGVPALLRNIIDVQMAQIFAMRAWLDTYGADPVYCPTPTVGADSPAEDCTTATGLAAALAAAGAARAGN